MNKMLTQEEKKYLLELARKTIIDYPNSIPAPDFNNLPEILKEKRGVFVTLTINNELRGCIGYISPIKSLYESVVENAVNAAYSDPRFPPLSKNELDKIRIEISILTEPKKLIFSDSSDLLEKLSNDDGVILQKSYRTATFLPQVWEQLPDKEEFLTHLCLKAGLHPYAWKERDSEVLTYKVEKFEE